MARVVDIKVGMEIAAKIMGEDYQLGGAEHDIIYLLPPGTEISHEDAEKLKGADWNYNPKEGWYHFA